MSTLDVTQAAVTCPYDPNVTSNLWVGLPPSTEVVAAIWGEVVRAPLARPTRRRASDRTPLDWTLVTSVYVRPRWSGPRHRAEDTMAGRYDPRAQEHVVGRASSPPADGRRILLLAFAVEGHLAPRGDS